MGWVKLGDLHFVSLPSAVFCVECELVSENNTPHCLACGSSALLSLSRILGGSLQRQQRAHLIADVELDRLVRDLLRTVPIPATLGGEAPVSFSAHAPSRHHARAFSAIGLDVDTANDLSVRDAEFDLGPAISIIAERAQVLTGATGSAIALRTGDEIVCRARTGRTAPDLGVRLQTNSGISAECVRTGEVVLCDDADKDAQVDAATCRHLGVRSILAAPLRHFRRTLGVFEVLSSFPHAFDQRDVATMQLLSSVMVAAISRLASLRASSREQTA